jgi:hypothetical protein
MRAYAAAMPSGATVSVPRDWLLELLANAPEKEQHSTTSPSPSTPQYMTVKQTAAILACKSQWLYQHAATLPFMCRLGSRSRRVDAGKLNAWITRQSR